jgi:hypothetical protein
MCAEDAMSERDHQVALFAWRDLVVNRAPALAYLFAIPNGGLRHKAVAAKLKSEGVQAGVPDVFLPVPGALGCGLWIELKSARGALSAEQRRWREFLTRQGYGYVLCRTWDEAARIICVHLNVDAADVGL